MADLKRLDFEERGEQWFILETYSDGHSRAGKSFMALGHERSTELAQVLRRAESEYPGYRPLRIPYDEVHEKHYSFEVEPAQAK